MRYKAYLVLPILFVAMTTSGPSLGQEQKGAASQGKREKGNQPPKQATPKAGEKLSIAPRKKREGRRAGATGVSDYYYATTPTVGGFHLANQTGRAIFRWASPSLNYDVTLTLSDDIAVGEDVGWTYSVDGMQFYLFFSKFTTLACGTDKWEIKGSYDNDTFFTFACAE